MRHIIITIGRQSGSGGRKIGELLAEKLGIPCYGKSELQKIAEGTDDYEEVQSFYEEEPVNSLLYAIAMSQFEQEVGRIPFRRIRELASKESCIIIGRCAGHIFREDPEAVRVFIHAEPSGLETTPHSETDCPLYRKESLSASFPQKSALLCKAIQ